MNEKNDHSQTGIESLGLELNGHRAFYLGAGLGPPVLLLHGGASDSRDWAGTMASLRHRFSLYAPDMPGFGRSERKESGYYFSDFTDFLLAFTEKLGLRNTALVGHSLGGRIALELARDHPERFNRLVLVDSAGFGKVSALGSALLSFFHAARKLLRTPQPSPRLLVREGEASVWTHAGALGDIKVPTLIIWKRHDLYFPLRMARQAAEAIPGASLAVLPGYGHAPHLQRNGAFSSLLLNFLGGTGC